jgi:DNA polymerase-3 subunit chi
MISAVMARVDFYLLAAAGETSRDLFACRLAEKAYRLQHTVHICTADRQHARQLDELLWTFRDGSFVPHEILGEGPDSTGAPVTIGSGANDVQAGELRGDLLINLTDELPELISSFPRVAEIVTSDEDCRQKSRKRFAGYRTQGHSLQTHEL